MRRAKRKKSADDLLADPAVGTEVEDQRDAGCLAPGDICECGDPLYRHDEEGACMACKCEKFRLAP